MTIRIAIFGIGAMGCLFGARLSPHADVTLIGRWPEQIDALRQGPLRIVHPDGREDYVRLRATDDASAVGTVDVALIVTKSAKTARVAGEATRILAPEGLAITLQNGLGNLEILAEHVGNARAALGTTTMGVSTNGQAGVLYLGGVGPTVLATRPEIDGRVRALAALFAQAGLATDVVEDVRGLVWGKLAVNAAINPLTALLRVPNGALVESAWAARLMDQIAAEVAAVAAALDIALPFPGAAAQAHQVAHRTASNRSSMLQDIQRGAETEIEAICGVVIRAGEDAGVPTPVNRLMYALVKAVEDTARLHVVAKER